MNRPQTFTANLLSKQPEIEVSLYSIDSNESDDTVTFRGFEMGDSNSATPRLESAAALENRIREVGKEAGLIFSKLNLHL